MEMDNESADLGRHRFLLAIRFAATGALAAICGTVLFFIAGLMILPFIPPHDWLEYGVSAAQVWALLGLAYAICLLIPMLVSALPFALAGRWACSLAFLCVWGVLYPLAEEAARTFDLTPLFLAGALVMTFLGGDIGDRLRQRRERARMKRDAELHAQRAGY